jgi:hypothetical protein
MLQVEALFEALFEAMFEAMFKFQRLRRPSHITVPTTSAAPIN